MSTRYLFVVSWVLLLVLAAVITFFSITSTVTAYGGPDALTPTLTLEQLDATDPEAARAVRGRRVTAATWALAYGILLAFVVLFPYRRGERWAWWALLVSLGVSQLLSIARVAALGMSQGAGTSGILLALLLLGLMAGAPRIFARELTT
jgi:hypothetical protein